ncbi:MAG: hypothetical protein ACXWNC_07385 [Anaerolineales bacterium]
MAFNLSSIDLNAALWLCAVVVAIVLIFVAVRFFMHHVLRFLFHGCAAILLIGALLFLLHYLKIF